jgi:hypothetical protein
LILSAGNVIVRGDTVKTLLVALFLAPPAAAASSAKANRIPEGVFQGKGYYFSLPKDGTTTYKTELEPGEGGEQVYIFPPDLPRKKLDELPPGKYGRLGIVKLEVVRPEKGEDVTLKSLEEQTIEDFQATGAKVHTTELSVLTMPGFYARVEGTEKFALYLLKGKEVLYYVTSGLEDRHALEVVRTLGEGTAPRAAAAEQPSSPPDVFGGKRLSQGKNGDYALPDSNTKGFNQPDYAKPDNYTSTGTYGR